MGRQPCCDKVGLRRGPWTLEEDRKLINFIFNNGIQCWRTIPKRAGLLRCGKSCRLRWINYLRPDLKRGEFSEAEGDQIIELHSRLGNRWSKIASHFPGRTDNEIKNHWNTRIKKRLKILGLDPITHKPIVEKGKADKIELLSSKIQDDHETSDIISPGDIEIMYKIFNAELWISYSSDSVSLDHDNSSNTSVGDSSLVQLQQEDSLEQWVDRLDSIISWDSNYNIELDQGLFFFEQH